MHDSFRKRIFRPDAPIIRMPPPVINHLHLEAQVEEPEHEYVALHEINQGNTVTPQNGDAEVIPQNSGGEVVVYHPPTQFQDTTTSVQAQVYDQPTPESLYEAPIQVTYDVPLNDPAP